jgi:hypothetical protein
VPPGVVRGFRNVSDDVAHLLILVTGGVSDMNDIAMTPEYREKLSAFGPQVLPELEKTGLRLDAGVERRDVFDNAIHCYDMSDEPAEDRADARYCATFCSRWCRRPLGRLQRRPIVEFRRRWTIRSCVDGLRRRPHRHGDGAGRAAVRLVQDSFAPVLTQHDGEALP